MFFTSTLWIMMNHGSGMDVDGSGTVDLEEWLLGNLTGSSGYSLTILFSQLFFLFMFFCDWWRDMFWYLLRRVLRGPLSPARAAVVREVRRRCWFPRAFNADIGRLFCFKCDIEKVQWNEVTRHNKTWSQLVTFETNPIEFCLSPSWVKWSVLHSLA